MSKLNFSVYRYTGSTPIKISSKGKVLGHIIKNTIYSVSKDGTDLEIIAYISQRPYKFRMSISKTKILSLLEHSELLSRPMRQIRSMLTPEMNTGLHHALVPPVGRMNASKDYTQYRRLFNNLVSRITLATSTVPREYSWNIDTSVHPIPRASITFNVNGTRVEFATNYNTRTGQFQLRFSSSEKRTSALVVLTHLAHQLSLAVVDWLERDIGMTTLVPPTTQTSEVSLHGELRFNYLVSFLV